VNFNGPAVAADVPDPGEICFLGRQQQQQQQLWMSFRRRNSLMGRLTAINARQQRRG